MKNIRIACFVLAAALALAAGAQTARLGSLPGDTMVVTNTSALQLTQAMLDALNATNAAAVHALNATNAAALLGALDMIAAMNATNAALTARILSLTNGWAQYDALVQQTSATVRLYQPDTELRWAWLTPTNIAVTTLTRHPPVTNITWTAADPPGSDGWRATNFPPAVAAGPGGFLASVAAPPGQPSLFRSADGAAWTALAADAYMHIMMPVSNAVFLGAKHGLLDGHQYSVARLSQDGGATWTNLEPPGSGQDLLGYMRTDAHLYTVPGDRFVYYADAADPSQWFDPDHQFQPGCYPNLFATDGGAVYRAYNSAGSAWLEKTPQITQKSPEWQQVLSHVPPIRRIQAAGGLLHVQYEHGAVHASADGGATFGLTALPPSYAPYTVTALDRCLVAQTTNTTHISADGGATWLAAAHPAGAPLEPANSFVPWHCPPAALGDSILVPVRTAGGWGLARGTYAVTTNYTSETVAVPLWGDWQADVAADVAARVPPAVAAAAAGMATTQQVAAASNALAQAAGAHAAQRNPHGTTAADVGAITSERDLAALRLYHYGAPCIIESPAEWFEFNAGAGSITAFSYEAGRENVVVPWEIGGVAVRAIGGAAFGASSLLSSVTLPRSIVTLAAGSFASTGLTEITVPDSVAQIGADAFYDCFALTNVIFRGRPPQMDAAFGAAPGTLVATVPDPQAAGWGAALPAPNDFVPVVRPALHAGAVRMGASGTALASGALNGTNGVFFSLSGTNYWILLEAGE
jgi:hypothetical protein